MSEISDIRISIEDFPLYEEEYTVNTPISLEACKLEGISPKDLLYTPVVLTSDNIKNILNEYESKKREIRRVHFINLVKERKKILIREHKQPQKFYSSLSYGRRPRPHSETKHFDIIQSKLLNEIKKTDYYKEIKDESDTLAKHKEKTERNNSMKSRESMLTQYKKTLECEKEEKVKTNEIGRAHV